MNTPQQVARSMFSPPPAATPRASAQPPPAAITAAVEMLAKHLRVRPDQLILMSSGTLEKGVGELAMGASARAEVDIWLGLLRSESVTKPVTTSSSDATTILANEVRRQNENKLFAWSAAEENVRRLVATYGEEYTKDRDAAWSSLREAFTAKAKIGSLGHTENLVGQYLLYAPDREYGSYLLMSILLKAPSARRISVHNWLLAQDMNRSDVEAFGDAIQALTVPLFPLSAPLASHNAATLEKQMSLLLAPPVGSGTLPVALLPDGTYGVDVGCVEDACHNLQQQINFLLQQKRELRSRLPQVPGHQRQQQQQQPQQRQQQNRQLQPQQQQQQPQQYQLQQQQQQQHPQQQQQQQRQYRGGRPKGGQQPDPLPQLDIDELFADHRGTQGVLPIGTGAVAPADTPKTIVARPASQGNQDLGFLGVRR